MKADNTDEGDDERRTCRQIMQTEGRRGGSRRERCKQIMQTGGSNKRERYEQIMQTGEVIEERGISR